MAIKRKHINLVYLIYSIYFVIFLVIIVIISKFIFNFNIFADENLLDTTEEKFTITAYKLTVPTEYELQTLEDNYYEIYNNIASNLQLADEITGLYDEVTNAPVCSKANLYFNLLHENFDIYKKNLSEIQKEISLFEEQYTLYLSLLSKIPKFSNLYQENYIKFMEIFEVKYNSILEKKQKISNKEKELYALHTEAQRVADELFEEYFNLMCHIVYAEAGIDKCTFMERCYVANVIENRIASNRFPNNIYDVVYSPEQYAPVINGSINNTPSQEVIEQVESYLRGHVDTEMPDYVVFQALFEQGTGIWKAMPSGHYFCY
ncbi:MAG: hypothetical protein HFJ49_01535 [Clostridia bacterium]|nr:hypothetical protein [Clostridia bacterium]